MNLGVVFLRSNLPHCWKNVSLENITSKSIVYTMEPKVFPNVPELELF